MRWSIKNDNSRPDPAECKAAWALDELEESIEKIYQDKRIAGILEIKGIGQSLARQIGELLGK